VSQHTPLAQKPVAHCDGVVQAPPCGTGVGVAVPVEVTVGVWVIVGVVVGVGVFVITLTRSVNVGLRMTSHSAAQPVLFLVQPTSTPWPHMPVAVVQVPPQVPQVAVQSASVAAMEQVIVPVPMLIHFVMQHTSPRAVPTVAPKHVRTMHAPIVVMRAIVRSLSGPAPNPRGLDGRDS